MSEKTTPTLFNTALAQLEEIVAELESNDNANELLTDFEVDIINHKSGANLTGFENLTGLNKIIPPKK